MGSSFWLRVDTSAGPDGCWPWTGAVNASGYGRAHHDGRDWYAHRLAYTLAKGPIPKGSIILHMCPHPPHRGTGNPCCNPAHLEVGTPRDNALDRTRRGRGYKQRERRNRDRKYW